MPVRTDPFFLRPGSEEQTYDFSVDKLKCFNLTASLTRSRRRGGCWSGMFWVR